MKQAGVMAVSLLCVPLLAAGYLYSEARKDVRNGFPLRFQTTTHDFGRVAWGPGARYAFRFVNASNREVTIDSATGTCGCTVPTLSARRFRPGESGTVTVNFNASGLAGKIQKEARLQLQGFQKQRVLNVQANADPLLTPVPMEVDFGNLMSGRPAAVNLTLKNTSGQPVQITGLKSSADYVQARVLPAFSGSNGSGNFRCADEPAGGEHKREH